MNKKTNAKRNNNIANIFPDICKTPESHKQNSIPTPNYGKNTNRKLGSKKAKIRNKPVYHK